MRETCSKLTVKTPEWHQWHCLLWASKCWLGEILRRITGIRETVKLWKQLIWINECAKQKIKNSVDVLCTSSNTCKTSFMRLTAMVIHIMFFEYCTLILYKACYSVFITWQMCVLYQYIWWLYIDMIFDEVI